MTPGSYNFPLVRAKELFLACYLRSCSDTEMFAFANTFIGNVAKTQPVVTTIIKPSPPGVNVDSSKVSGGIFCFLRFNVLCNSYTRDFVQ